MSNLHKSSVSNAYMKLKLVTPFALVAGLALAGCADSVEISSKAAFCEKVDDTSFTVFELSTHMSSVSRADGRSATAAAAYRACCVIECDREGRIHDYTRKRGLEVCGIILPGSVTAPRWMKDRADAWNGAEARETNKDKRAKTPEKANARPARDVMFSFPFAMSEEGRLDCAMKIARYLADNHLILVDYAIHKPGRKGDWRNFHCHMLLSTRRVTKDGFGEKAREFDDRRDGPVLMKKLRKFIADTQNDRLKFEGKADKVVVEYRSFWARGSAQVPTRHVGQHGHIQSKYRNKVTKAWDKAHSQYQKERHARELAALKLRQDFSLQTKLATLAQRGRDAEAAIRGKFAEQRRADPDSTGMRRLFQIVTGREGRAAFDRLSREDRRTVQENAQIQGLKREVQAARNEFVTAAGQGGGDRAARCRGPAVAPGCRRARGRRQGRRPRRPAAAAERAGDHQRERAGAGAGQRAGTVAIAQKYPPSP
jgi:hypothetical protein